jgi:mRNA interferase RelE/StbE
VASYKLVFKPSVEKDLPALPKATRIPALARIESLSENPFPPDFIKLSGARKLYRIRIGDYRVVYEVDAKAQLITVHYVRHRREVYRRI